METLNQCVFGLKQIYPIPPKDRWEYSSSFSRGGGLLRVETGLEL